MLAQGRCSPSGGVSSDVARLIYRNSQSLTSPVLADQPDNVSEPADYEKPVKLGKRRRYKLTLFLMACSQRHGVGTANRFSSISSASRCAAAVDLDRRVNNGLEPLAPQLRELRFFQPKGRPAMPAIRPLLIVGTRAEAVKMAPVILECQRRGTATLQPIVCFSGQHQEMLFDVAAHFGIQPDIRLRSDFPRGDVATLTAQLIEQLSDCAAQVQPDCMVVQGDTATALAGAMAGFLGRVPVVHIEAGLRTDSLASPWPEEFNRRVITLAAALHCAPTPRQADQLVQEGVDPARIVVTGNPVVDALHWTIEQNRHEPAISAKWDDLLAGKRLIIVTAHRRESFDGGIARICEAISELAARCPDHLLVFPVHPNPHVQNPVRRLLGDSTGVYLTPPLQYAEMVHLLSRAELLLTDSGGLQEEAPTLRLPVLVMRDQTERVELLQRGGSQLVGTTPARIIQATLNVLHHPDRRARMQAAGNPYGDGQAAHRIVDLLITRGWDLDRLAAPVQRFRSFTSGADCQQATRFTQLNTH